MHRILVVNPNTSEKSSEIIRMALKPYLHQGLQVKSCKSASWTRGHRYGSGHCDCCN